MADHFPTGVSLARGDLLVATPRLRTLPWRKSVIFLTETSNTSIMGTILNRPTMMTTQDVTDVDMPTRQIYMGGPISTQAMFMLHTSDFASTNTLYVTDSWSVSSDPLMFDKLSMGAEPTWHRMYMGAAAWYPQQLAQELAQDSWMIIRKPSYNLITEPSETQWQVCVDCISQTMFDQYL